MSNPRFPANPFTDMVPRRGATSSKSGLDTYRRLASVEQAVSSNTSVDTDSLNLMRAMGSTVLGWSYDPGFCETTTATHTGQLASGTLYVVAVYLPTPATVTGVLTHTAIAGVGTWTIGKAAIYDTAGTRLAVSANSTTIWKSLNLNQIPMSATVDLDRGVYYCAVLNVRSTTTTAPSLTSRNGYSDLQNVLTAANYPRAAFITGQTDMPASITLSSFSLSTGSRWMGLY
jgi:hypothetical protein